MNELITAINDIIWSYVLIVALVGCGLWFTWRTRFAQFRMVGEMFRLLTDSVADTVDGSKGRHHISSFQAFAVSVATRVGTGNLAGVALAIAIGGPGAVFWMWIIALIGSATAFVESTLAQLYKQKHRFLFIGGPAYYIQKGLKQRWMAVLFAILITLQFGLSNNSIQANTIRMGTCLGRKYSCCNGSDYRLWRHTAHRNGQFRTSDYHGSRLPDPCLGDHHHEYPPDTSCIQDYSA